MKYLSSFFINLIWAALMYLAFAENVVGARNVLTFVVWVFAILLPIVCIVGYDTVNKMPVTPSFIRFINNIRNTILVLLFVWSGYYWTGLAAVWAALWIAVMDESKRKNKKELETMVGI